MKSNEEIDIIGHLPGSGLPSFRLCQFFLNVLTMKKKGMKLKKERGVIMKELCSSHAGHLHKY